MALILTPLCLFCVLPNYICVYGIIVQKFSYLDKREVLQQEYFQLLIVILPSPHFRWVVKLDNIMCNLMELYD